MSVTENIPKKRLSVPPLSEVPTYEASPLFLKIRIRALVVYITMCITGILPYLLTSLGVVDFPVYIQAAGWGLFFPGSALIAVGNIWCIVLGLLIFAFFYKFGLVIMQTAGMLVLNVYLWILSIIGGLFLAKNCIPVYSIFIISALVLAVAIPTYRSTNRQYNERLKKRKQREEYFDNEIEAFENSVDKVKPDKERELSVDALKASRYLFDMTLRQPGDFSGYESNEQFQLSSIRYSLDYLGYAMALMQCAYTPNFHGYLNKAQQFVIESFTHPQVCGYWKWEYLGGMLRWDPDPIRNQNIMFSGWSGLVVTLYGSNTGDLRYESPGALKFRPSAKNSRTYDYSSKEIVDVLVRQFKEYPTKLFPCEPNWVFPICNAYGLSAILPYDRLHQTRNLESIYDDVEISFKANFFEPSGDFTFMRNALLGVNTFVKTTPDFEAMTAFGSARLFNALDPGLAKRTYVLAKKEYILPGNREIKASFGEWDNMLDIGNFKRSPGCNIGIMAAAACEMGDRQTVKDLLEVADKHMKRYDDKDMLAYKVTSVSGNANIACARFAEKDDWYDMMHKGPGTGALTGPILSECKYPNVLVARAMSDGNDLDMVLYNGGSPGVETIGIERLQPGKEYRVMGISEQFTADATGKVKLNIALDGRTKVHIVPA